MDVILQDALYGGLLPVDNGIWVIVPGMKPLLPRCGR